MTPTELDDSEQTVITGGRRRPPFTHSPAPSRPSALQLGPGPATGGRIQDDDWFLPELELERVEGVVNAHTRADPPARESWR